MPFQIVVYPFDRVVRSDPDFDVDRIGIVARGKFCWKYEMLKPVGGVEDPFGMQIIVVELTCVTEGLGTLLAAGIGPWKPKLAATVAITPTAIIARARKRRLISYRSQDNGFPI